MNIFKSRMYTWWQMGFIKVALIMIGIAIGANWPILFFGYTKIFVSIGLLLIVYSAVIPLFKKGE